MNNTQNPQQPTQQDSQYSHMWFQVSKIVPCLRDHISVHRQEYRDQIWFVYQDRATNRYHRFSQEAHQIIGLMNGQNSMQAIWETLKSKDAHQAPDQDEIIQLLGQLHSTDLLQANFKSDAEELYQRAQSIKPSRLKSFLRNPISMRIPLLDPDNFLTRTQSFAQKLFTGTAFIFWLLSLIIGLVLCLAYWPELSDHAIKQSLLPQNLLLLGLTYPIIKLFHELGHAYAVKHWGGEVHEMGVIFILLMPIPYVDASSASAFSSKYQRIIVGAAGIMVELFLACLALFVWLSVEPGITKDIAFNIMLIGGVSTLFFNGNPLLRYDGYYVFSDAIAIPNLASRSIKYMGYIIQRYAFGLLEADSPANTANERWWMLAYAPSAFLYRMLVLVFIIFLVADTSFWLGVLLALWLSVNQVFVPLYKHTLFILTLPRANNIRTRGMTGSAILLTLILSCVFILPFPMVTMAQGVTWLPENTRILSASNGFITKIVTAPNSLVDIDDPILKLNDPLLHSQIKILRAELAELQAQYNANWRGNRVESKIIKEEIIAVQADIEEKLKQQESLTVRSTAVGRLVIPNAQDLPGKFLKKGDFIAYIINSKTITARVVVEQKDTGLLQRINNVKIMYAGNTQKYFSTKINRIVPELNYQLPSAVLGSMGGGRIAVDPQDDTGLRSLERIIQIDLDLDTRDTADFIGQRLYVRFDHGSAPLAKQWFRSIRQLFLRRFNV